MYVFAFAQNPMSFELSHPSLSGLIIAPQFSVCRANMVQASVPLSLSLEIVPSPFEVTMAIFSFNSPLLCLETLRGHADAFKGPYSTPFKSTYNVSQGFWHKRMS